MTTVYQSSVGAARGVLTSLQPDIGQRVTLDKLRALSFRSPGGDAMLAVPAQRRATTCTAVTWTAPDAGGAMTDPDPRTAAQPDAALVAQLRAGDAAAFRFIVKNWSPAMLHLARTFVSTHASAEEMVQETWLAVI